MDGRHRKKSLVSGGLLVLIINLFPCADSGIIMQQHRRQIIKHSTRKNNNSYQIKWQLANLTKQGKLLHIFFPSLMACHIWYLCQNKPPVNATTTDYNILHFHYGKFYSSKGKNEQKLQTAKSTSRDATTAAAAQIMATPDKKVQNWFFDLYQKGKKTINKIPPTKCRVSCMGELK